MGAADGHRHSVHGERVALADPGQEVQRLAARDQVVLRERLEPVDVRALRQDGLVVIDPESQAKAERRTDEHLEPRSGRAPLNDARRCSEAAPRCLSPRKQAARFPCWVYFAAFALAASHCALVISRKPLPLQEFWPLQELLADLQAECPLQEFTPSHLTLPSSAALAVEMAAVENSTAAAAARATLDILRELIRSS